MKRNAMIRIVLWSLLALVLLGILITGLFGYVGRNHYRTSTEATVVQVDLGQGNATQKTIPAATAAQSMDSDIPIYVTLRDASVYADADAASDIVENLPAESYLYILETVGTSPAWAAVSIDSVTAYIPMSDLLPIPQDVIFPAVVKEDADTHSAPNERSEVVRTFEKGTTLGISRIEMVGDEAWGYLDAEQLWIPMSRVHVGWDKNSEPAVPEDAAAPTETEPNPALADRILFDPKQVRNLEIDWAAGSVTIVPSNVGRITISETPVDRPEEALAYTLHGDTLRIRYYEKKTNPTFNHRHSKDLTILVPRDFVLNALSVDTASADLSVTDMSIGEADVDGASGRCRFENCQLGSLSVDTVSGDVFVSGTATELDLDCVSSAIQAQLTNVPNEISSDTTSGSLELTLPKDAGFTLELETIGGNFRSDFNTTKNGSIYRCGDGRCEIEVDSVSGGVTIRKGA